MHQLFKALLCLSLSLLANVSIAQTKLTAWNIHPEGYPVTEAIKSFAEEVGKATTGKYQIEVFSSASLGDQPKAVQMLKSGEIDIAEFSSGPLSDAVPGIKVLKISPEALVVSTKLGNTLDKDDKAAFAAAGAKSALLMRELWNKRVVSSLESTTKQGAMFVKVKDVSPMVRRMGPLYGKYMADAGTREELLTIIAD